tara:strand:- start:268 stop:390 length:123 start_codon:yes stop_codon:yes gene_type:complete
MAGNIDINRIGNMGSKAPFDFILRFISSFLLGLISNASEI